MKLCCTAVFGARTEAEAVEEVGVPRIRKFGKYWRGGANLLEAMILKIINEKNTDETIRVSIGEPFQVELDENPTTGYCWEIDAGHEALRLEESLFHLPADSKDGAGGKRLFKFIPLREVAIKLSLKLYREWEGDDSIIERHVFFLKAQSRGVESGEEFDSGVEC